jgi:hypothetical protein
MHRLLILALAIALTAASQADAAWVKVCTPGAGCKYVWQGPLAAVRSPVRTEAPALTAAPAPVQVAPVTHKSEANHSRPFVGKHKATFRHGKGLRARLRSRRG